MYAIRSYYALVDKQYYRPKASGYEKIIAERLAWWASRRQGETQSGD